jgi:hypothetical protein
VIVIYNDTTDLTKLSNQNEGMDSQTQHTTMLTILVSITMLMIMIMNVTPLRFLLLIIDYFTNH